MANRLRQTVQSIQEGTPAEQRMDAGGRAPNLTKGLTGGLQSVAEILGPQADIAAMVEEARRAESSFSKGDYLDAAGSMGLAAIAPLMIATPGSVKSVREISERAVSPLRRLFEDLPEETKQALPKQPSETGLFGYHGSAKGRLEEKDKDYFDIQFGNPNDQFMGEGFYFTINPKVAEEYANLRSNKDFQPIRKADPSRPGKTKDTGEYINPKTKEKATTASLMKGVDIEGKPLLGGQNISRFNLENIEKPYVIKNNKQRLYAKENINKLKEDGYDSILFKDFDDRSQQILVFPEHIGKVSGNTIKETVTKKSKGGSVVERNPYANYQSKAI